MDTNKQPMKQCYLEWMTFGEYQESRRTDKEFHVVSLPMSNNKEVPPKLGVHTYR